MASVLVLGVRLFWDRLRVPMRSFLDFVRQILTNKILKLTLARGKARSARTYTQQQQTKRREPDRIIRYPTKLPAAPARISYQVENFFSRAKQLYR